MKRLILLVLACFAWGQLYAQMSFGDAAKFNEGWKFLLEDKENGQDVDVDDSQWRSLNVPHDWSIEHNMSPDLASCQGYLPGGIAWYRKTFKVEKQAQRYYIYFEGVYNRSEVYLNGKLLGKRPHGYISFMYDMTDALKLNGEENVLAVRVDHSRQADSRWYSGSGIYRDVWMITSGDVHLAPWGLTYRAMEFKGDKARMEIDVAVESHSDQDVTLGVINELFDAKGKAVVQHKQVLGTMAKGQKSATLSVVVPDVKRWDVDNPHLYTLKTRLYADSKLVDSTTTSVGLRELQFDANKGFALNGKWMNVKGVCLHHDAGVLGAAVPPDVWRRRIQILKKVGVNAIRMSHNPQAPALYHICDEEGMLVMDEAFDEWEFPKRKWRNGWNQGQFALEGSYDFFEEWCERDVTDMVLRDRNHPCIFLWSVGNEVDYPNDPYSHPVLGGGDTGFTQKHYGGYDPKAPDAMRIGVIAQRMADCIRKVDTSRPTTGALAGVLMSNQTTYPEAVDVVGYNYTEGRYEKDHAAYPDRILYGSENRADYAAWKHVRDKDYIFGQFIWTGMDYLGESNKWPSRGLGTGLLDFEGNRKPTGEFRASLWSADPFIYIGTYPRSEDLSLKAPARWNYKEGQKIRVVCYTNLGFARLLLNGKEVGAKKAYDKKEGLIYWDIDYSPGELKVEGCNADGKIAASYSIVTAGEEYALRAYVEESALSGPERVAHVVVEVVDAKGNLVKSSKSEVQCVVKGAGRLLGLEGGHNSDTSNAQDSKRKMHGGNALAYVESTAAEGEIVVEFTSPSLKPASVVIKISGK